MRCNGRNPSTWNRHACSDVDALRVNGGQSQCRITVRPDHLRIGHPCPIISEILREFDAVPFAHVSVYGYCKLHSDPPMGFKISLYVNSVCWLHYRLTNIQLHQPSTPGEIPPPSVLALPYFTVEYNPVESDRVP